jgi:hypothetical protein
LKNRKDSEELTGAAAFKRCGDWLVDMGRKGAGYRPRLTENDNGTITHVKHAIEDYILLLLKKKSSKVEGRRAEHLRAHIRADIDYSYELAVLKLAKLDAMLHDLESGITLDDYDPFEGARLCFLLADFEHLAK